MSMLAACAPDREGVAPQPPGTVLSLHVEDELRAGALLVDVRGPTERASDGSSRLPHLWQVFGPDRWRGATAAEQAAFLASMAEHDATRSRRILVLCSVGVRSDAAAQVLAAAGYRAVNLRDGWLGNHAGPGLREVERMMEE